ncbi:MAG: hypothetical protein A2X52_09215 [Candidatus Rokubacteria bacterium GWC2_70_16]|nr:MAG: hypothetical protein A2X52_09215 [Candidatus Rokubacteria bacterium GWC2_70_16]
MNADDLGHRERLCTAEAEFARHAMAASGRAMLMDEAVTLVARTLDVEFSKVLELLPQGGDLLLQAGVGWRPGLVGRATVPPEAASQAGYTLLRHDTVVVEDVRTEGRFALPALLRDHGIVAGMSAVIPGGERPFGVLGIHTPRPRRFSADEAHFLRHVADMLGAALARADEEERHRLSWALALQISTARDLPSGLLAVLEEVCRVTGWVYGEIWGIATDGASLRLLSPWHTRVPAGEQFRAASDGLTFPRGQDLPGRVWASGRPEWIPDVSLAPGFVRARAAAEAGFKAGMGIPIVSGGETVGVSVLFTSEPAARDPRLIPLVNAAFASVGPLFTQKRLEDEHTRLAEALQQVGEAVVITAADGTIVYVNSAFERVSSYSAADVLGRTPRVLKSGKHDNAFYERLWGTITQGQVWRGEMTNRRKDGSLYEVEHTIAPVRDAAGSITHFIAISKDIGERLAVEAQLRQAQKMDAVGQLTGGIAHDFNNLLTVILGRSELLGQLVPAEGPPHRHVKLIHQTAERAAGLTRQLLAFSRLQAIAPRVVDLNEVVGGMAQMLRRLIGEDIALDAALGAGLWLVKADPHQLEQVVMNLAINARDAMPHGGRLRVETANAELDEAFARQRPGATAGPHVQLAVSDTGGGMDEAIRARVFEPFFTTKEPGKGTGLGLSTVYGIVKQHDGYIEIESAPGRGATFRVYLPRTEAPAEPLEPDAGGRSAAGGSETILLVEDEAEVRQIAHEILTALGYRVLEAGRPAEAVGVLAAHPGPIHLLLTDVVMPEMSGPQLAARLTVERPGLRVLFVSGYTADALGPRGALAPGVALLQKPFTAEALAAKVREVLDRRPSEVPGQA